ncbi:MAG: hypothetical protein WDO69_29715 [Pseudomonadota bacterium]
MSKISEYFARAPRTGDGSPSWSLLLALCCFSVLASCHSDSKSNPNALDAGTETDAGPRTPPSTDPVTVDDLAATGLEVFADPTQQSPVVDATSADFGPTPVRLLQDQVDVMSLEAVSGQGVLGSDFDDLVSLGAGLPPASYFLAGYVSAAGTPGAQLAHEIMGDQDWHHASTLVYPMLVLTLFAADAARYANALSGDSARGSSSQALDIPMGLCSDAQNFIDSTISAFFDALGHLQSPMVPKSGFLIIDVFGAGLQAAFDLATGVVNGLIDAGRFIVVNGIKRAAQPLLDAMATVAGVASVAGTVVNVLRPWTVTVDNDPASTEQVAGMAVPGTMTATVKLPGGFDDWPPLLVDCAKVAMITLPPLKPTGAPVTWKLTQIPSPVALVQQTSVASMIDDHASASLGYATLPETERDANGERLEGKVDSDVSITRKEIADFQHTVSDLIFSQIPSLVSPYLTPLLKPQIDKVLGLPVELLATHGWGHLPVTYHECRSGQCCPMGQAECSAVCVDLTTDTSNCGACDHACAEGDSCVEGNCVSPPKPTMCSPACAAGQVCTGGTCQSGGIIASCDVPDGNVCVDYVGVNYTLTTAESACASQAGHVWATHPCATANRVGSCLQDAGMDPPHDFSYIIRAYPGGLDTSSCNSCESPSDCASDFEPMGPNNPTHPCMGGCCDYRQTTADAAIKCQCALPNDPGCPNWTPN